MVQGILREIDNVWQFQNTPNARMRKLKTKSYILISLAVVTIFFIAFLAYSEVDNSLTAEDHIYIAKYLEGIPPLPASRNYDNELDFIIQVQKSVLQDSAHRDALPFSTEREPKDLYNAKAGLCYDRSRAIEKILRYIGFETRHIAMYPKKKKGSAIKALLTPNPRSHAVTEVLTKKGWLVIDSNHRWVSIDSNKNPVSISQIQQKAEGSTNFTWNQKPPNLKYVKPFTFVYGLYSRHGKFFPPYNFVPDVNYKELVSNIL
jgi:transglutaminase superfamily protein